MSYLKLIRPINLLLIILVLCVIKYGLLTPLGVEIALTPFQFALLVCSTVCIAAAGNVINDIQDVTIDRINKPDKVIVKNKISEKNAYNAYLLLTILGVGAGFYLANSLGRPGLAVVFIIVSALLYMYATQLKSMLLVGNLTVSSLVAMSLIMIILFDIFPAIEGGRTQLQSIASKVILGYAMAAFFLNLIREIVKDLQDIDGDKNGGRHTLPIALGRERTTTVVFILGILALLGILAYTYFELYAFQNLAFYFVFLIAAPLLLFCIKAWSAKTKKDFGVLSILLKVIMFTGICSLFFYAEILMPI